MPVVKCFEGFDFGRVIVSGAEIHLSSVEQQSPSIGKTPQWKAFRDMGAFDELPKGRTFVNPSLTPYSRAPMGNYVWTGLRRGCAGLSNPSSWQYHSNVQI